MGNCLLQKKNEIKEKKKQQETNPKSHQLIRQWAHHPQHHSTLEETLLHSLQVHLYWIKSPLVILQ